MVTVKRPCIKHECEGDGARASSLERTEFLLRNYTSAMSSSDDKIINIVDLLKLANSALPPRFRAYDHAEIQAIIRKQQNENRLMFDETNGNMRRNRVCCLRSIRLDSMFDFIALLVLLIR